MVDMQHEAVMWHPYETGGVLLGYVNGGDIVVTMIVAAGPEAVHDEYGFEPDYDYQEERIVRTFNDTHGEVRYLGDWHSHPTGNCELSELDRRTLIKIAQYRQAKVLKPIMIIIGEGATRCVAWYAHRTGPRFWSRFQIQSMPVQIYGGSRT